MFWKCISAKLAALVNKPMSICFVPPKVAKASTVVNTVTFAFVDGFSIETVANLMNPISLCVLCLLRADIP